MSATQGRCTTRTPTPSATPSRTWSPPSPTTASRPGGSLRTVSALHPPPGVCELWPPPFSWELSSLMTRQGSREITEPVANSSRAVGVKGGGAYRCARGGRTGVCVRRNRCVPSLRHNTGLSSRKRTMRQRRRLLVDLEAAVEE